MAQFQPLYRAAPYRLSDENQRVVLLGLYQAALFIPEVVQDGITGRLVSVDDKGALGSAIVGLLNDRKKRMQMADAGKKWVYENFSSHAMLNALYRLYEG